ETASSGIAAFLEAYRDLIWGMRWLLAPACIATLSLIISNAISISVRERQTEFAVMKVLGYRPGQILSFVLIEALLVGTTAGVISAALTYAAINFGLGGLPFQIAFFPRFLVPISCLWWGAAMGAGTAFAGSVIPAWSARSVNVANVFAKVA
ncbi:MAG TPA: ABC transporter permease, partial [Planctomycetaceae bacterium]|nr:ABC transporter permease [Planctomycetaceae bacterium]